MNRQRWHLDYDGEFRREEMTEMWNHVDDMIKKIKHDEHMERLGRAEPDERDEEVAEKDLTEELLMIK